MIFCVVCKIFLVGGSRICHPSRLAMEKSSRLNGSAMFACVGTRCRICRNCCLLCQVQCAPIKLLRGMCLPEPLMMAWVAASLSQSWM